MQEILQKVGELFIGSIPTAILFIFLVLSYQFLVQGPLTRILRERRARTAGAVEEAHKAIAAAEAKAGEYANQLRQARAEIFRMREHRLQVWAQERESALDAARKRTSQQIDEAKAALRQEAEAARQTLAAGADQLAEQVVRSVMPAIAGGSR
jgi:F-type H+-transporting ATPase subunit b